jgi:hypothetical protein
LHPGDRSLRTSYIDTAREVGVQVTISTYADPTWVLHEFTGGSCGGSSDLAGEAGRRYFQYVTVGPDATGGHVAWASGQATLVAIEFTLGGPNRSPETPTEIVDAYLALYPSTLSDSLADAIGHCRAWVPDEMRRLLEYAARDLTLARTPQPADPGVRVRWHGLREDVLRWLGRFSEYRERFYAGGDHRQFAREMLDARFAYGDPGTETLDVERYLQLLEARLNEFQSWWTAHQNDPVILPTPVPTPASTPTAVATP